MKESDIDDNMLALKSMEALENLQKVIQLNLLFHQRQLIS